MDRLETLLDELMLLAVEKWDYEDDYIEARYDRVLGEIRVVRQQILEYAQGRYEAGFNEGVVAGP